ncbi:VOC family protein [Alicyclobacillus cycloheptanicus]|uniref:Glyoxalase/fosfomycin resistance/dioxygenase domain-containing protein n=1 Tax=Alicyclobacillus cycloheptanicus TaxID=1457 RepID=A0ABT9XGY7_9BACL|nr:VOC family protein [Alicyclobacillus cycloheptanicus]MDQ0189078.1 hypothetical protein [Alicyclobacillus cycloheptanicus]WDM00213.1 VOC family protein [Alicyclobacillus cycloheptanicus]
MSWSSFIASGMQENGNTALAGTTTWIDHILQPMDCRACVDVEPTLRRLGFHRIHHVSTADARTHYTTFAAGNVLLQFMPTTAPLRSARAAGQAGVTRPRAHHHVPWIALGTDDIEHKAVELRAKGFRVSDPVPYVEILCSDNLMRSKIIHVESASGLGIPCPCFVQWEPAETQHASSARPPLDPRAPRLREIAIAVENLPRVVEHWGALTKSAPSESWIQSDIQAYCVRIPVQDEFITLCEPIGAGKIRDLLRIHGPQPFLFSFHEAPENRELELQGITLRLEKQAQH